jgi:hypothetical protein
VLFNSAQSAEFPVYLGVHYVTGHCRYCEFIMFNYIRKVDETVAKPLNKLDEMLFFHQTCPRTVIPWSSTPFPVVFCAVYGPA